MIALHWVTFAFVVFLPSVVSHAERWSCGPTSWASPPQMRDGYYESTLGIECTMPSPASLLPLRVAIEKALSDRGEFHRPPLTVLLEGMRGQSFDLTHTLNGEDKGLRLREEVLLATDGESRLIYQTRSKQIFASGMAGYLKGVSFQTVLKRPIAGDSVTIEMRNSVRVKRPWFALSPLFFSIAKGIAEDKFEEARVPLLTFIADTAYAAPIDPKGE